MTSPSETSPGVPANSQSHGSLPAVTLPKGGGAIRGIGEKFAANPVSGTGSTTVPLLTSPGRSGFGPSLELSYDSGSGNGPFGFGWSLSLPNITRKTDKGLPQYLDSSESDVFILSGAEDLVPLLDEAIGWRRESLPPREINGERYEVQPYRPRIEGLFARIERWTNLETGESHWRSISRDNITTLYGKDDNSRIFAPADAGPQHLKQIYSWLICESFDDKGNAIVYEYAEEDDQKVDRALVSERNRARTANRYPKRIKYGNPTSRLVEPDLNGARWMFELVFDYEEGHYEELALDSALRPDAQHQLVRAEARERFPWSVRPDPFSVHRSGFEVRTYRRCQRVLMFHHFDELGEAPYLVRGTELNYNDFDYSRPSTIENELSHEGSTRFASFIRSITQSGYVHDEGQPLVEREGVTYATYIKKSLPPLEFDYSRAVIDDQIRELDESSLENLPAGIDGATYQFVDLDGEGLSGILTEQAASWFYKRNLGEGRFGPLETIKTKPSLAGLSSQRQQLIDLAGDGQLDLVTFGGPTPGFYERSQDESWEPFKPFSSQLNVQWDDPNLRFVDLNGDGHADVLITEHEVITWHESLAEEGFRPAAQVRQAIDEERGPRLIIADGTQSIYLADMCGDGLTDFVRIRNGDVCYWPNLGYGRFGPKVTMDNAPWFAPSDQFNQTRIRLADIDGSGVTDIIYLDASNGAQIYFNQAGNRLSEPRRLRQFPDLDSLSSVVTADLLGNGTACLIWSSALPDRARRALRYIDLMSGQKPHLMVKVANNLGAETKIQYTTSTKFYLSDRLNGKPWITRIPFPVHVVERIETVDRVSHNRFITRHAYHHGYYDGIEREFRGFAQVEQWDTEEFAALNAGQETPADTNIEESSHVPPVLTRRWFHTGVYLGGDRVSAFFGGLANERDVGEYYREPGLTDFQASRLLLDDTVLPSRLTVEEEREACRALKGSMLRQEIYALDGSDKESHPYSVTEQNFNIELVQPRGQNRHSVFFTHPREALSYQYEREPTDPRVSHTLTLEVDQFGNVLKSAAIGYGRRQPDPELEPRDQLKQSQLLITYTENDLTNEIEEPDDYRTPLPAESRTFELTGLALAAGQVRFNFDAVLTAAASASPLRYEEPTTSEVLQKRLIEQVRTLYRANDLTAPLALRELQSLALPFESYKLAFNPELILQIYDRRVLNRMFAAEGGYIHSEGDSNWWIPSGLIYYSPNSGDSAAAELAYARQHFFLPHRFRDPFHTDLISTESFVSYDGYDLLITESLDALGNRVTVGERDPAGNPTVQGNDYRVLQPWLVMEPNRNRTALSFDALGLVVGTAVMGKPPPASVEGDALEGFDANLTAADMLDHLVRPLTNPQTILARATTRLVYDLFAYYRTRDQPNPQPTVVYTIARETHASEPVPPGGLKIQHSFSYSDGFSREIQKKIQAEPGPAPQRDAEGKIVLGANNQPLMTPGDIAPRWVGSGWTVFNNKGKPVRQYEPFFTDTHHFEFDVRIGVSPVIFYDPVERVVATLHPNHTWEKVVFDPWRQETWDVSDTVLLADPADDLDVGDFFSRLPNADYLPTWHAQRQGVVLGPEEQAAARKTAIHSATPAVAYADSLGRTFLTVAHNKFKYSDSSPESPPLEEFYRARVNVDIEGNQREVIDAQDRIVMRYDYDMLGNRIHQASMEAGERWLLNDVAGKPLYAWDGRNHRFRTAYDQLRRPTDSFLSEGVGPELLVGRTVYGETQANPETANLRRKVRQVFDQAGVVTSDEYDFKGNLKSSSRQLASEYKSTLNWPAVPLEADIYTSSTRYDALNRPVEMIAPDNSVIRPTYNEANLLERVEANLGGAAIATSFVNDIDYDAKGQRTFIEYGNDVTTTYEYDPLTFRLIHLLTQRNAADFPGDCPRPPPPDWPGCQVQNLHYTYDPAGNITSILDEAQQTRYFLNKRVEPRADYTYDAISRLIEATGREHLGQVGNAPSLGSYNDKPRVGILLSASDGNAVGRYLERYVYDAAGNFQTMVHRGSDPVSPGWTRAYTYNETSLIEPGKQSNRLTSTTIGVTTENYGYDVHGNMLRLPQLQIMQWDFKDQLQVTQRQAVNPDDDEGVARQGERTWYVYDSSGQRVRKVTESAPDQIRDERIYLGGFEIYRRHGANPLVRETLHVMDDQQRVALVETRTEGDEPGVPVQLIRYQFSNHLGSASLELDHQAQIISYEEYYPYGSTSYQAVRNLTETPKRYRYTGKERDEESGLYYHGARYYISSLARWLSADPSGVTDSANLFEYARNNPIGYYDPDGRAVEGYYIGRGRPGNQPYSYFLGAAAHQLIAYNYSQNNPNDRAYYNSVSIASILADSGAGNPALLLPTERSLRPDITNVTTREVFEIKPWNPEGLQQGKEQLRSYLRGLNRAATNNGRFGPGTDFSGELGVRFANGVAGWRLSWQTTVPGVVQYRWQRLNPRRQTEEGFREAYEQNLWIDISEAEAAQYGEELYEAVGILVRDREAIEATQDVVGIIQDIVGILANALIMGARPVTQPGVQPSPTVAPIPPARPFIPTPPPTIRPPVVPPSAPPSVPPFMPPPPMPAPPAPAPM